MGALPPLDQVVEQMSRISDGDPRAMKVLCDLVYHGREDLLPVFELRNITGPSVCEFYEDRNRGLLAQVIRDLESTD